MNGGNSISTYARTMLEFILYSHGTGYLEVLCDHKVLKWWETISQHFHLTTIALISVACKHAQHFLCAINMDAVKADMRQVLTWRVK